MHVEVSFKMKKIVLLVLVLLAAAGGWFYKFKGSASPVETAICPLPPVSAQALHPGMVWVPAGSFVLGDTVYPEEKASALTHVKGFWMDRTEVSNDEFDAFVRATGYVTVAERAVDKTRHPGMPSQMYEPGALVFFKPEKINTNSDVRQWWRYQPGANWRHPGGPNTHIEGRGAFPVVAVTIEDAKAYAHWKGRTIPSEAQWEWAARGAQQDLPHSHAQPKDANTWQGIFPVVNSSEDGFAGMAPVGCYAPNALGLHDMIGNVWELTADAFALERNARPAAEPDQSPFEASLGLRNKEGGFRVIKGGSFLCSSDYCMRYRSGARQPQEDDLGTSHLGFRTVLQAPGPSEAR